MLKKLQIKIVLTIIISVMTVIIVALGIFTYININTYIDSTREIMQRETYFFINEYSDTEDRRPRFEELPPQLGFDRDIHEGYLYLALDEDGNIRKEHNNLGNDTISAYESLAREVQRRKFDFDIFYKGSKYFKVEWKNYTYIVLAISSEFVSYCFGMGGIFISIFLLNLILVIIISKYLAVLVLKPVKKAWEEQERFVADASHELRTPLSIILANLKILLKSTFQVDNKKWINISITEADRMQKLIENLLFLAKSDSGSLIYQIEKIDFSELLAESLLGFEVLAFEKNIDFKYNLEKECIVNGDKEALKQIVSILVDNAFKYCGEEKKVSIKLYRNSTKIIFSIENSGEIIETEKLKKIFDRFYRLDKQRSRESGGYGLGLSIAYALSKQMGAKIYAEAKEKGNEFILEF